MKYTRHKPRNLEHLIQCAVIQQCRLLEKKYPELRLLYAIPNGGARHPAVAAKLKAEGVRPGVPDLCLPLKSGRGYAGLYIEMKSSSGVLTQTQKDYIELLQWAGFKAVVCYSATDAMNMLTGYIERARSSRDAADQLSVFTRPQAD